MDSIFDVLYAADKELVHSAMLKFLIEFEGTKKGVLDLLEPKTFHSETVFPILEKIYPTENGNRVRFDLVLFNRRDNQLTNPLLVIENKFKATPTITQLKSYDEFLKEKNIKKVLFVFSLETVSYTHEKYCIQNGWAIISYLPISLVENGCSVLETLERLNNRENKEHNTKEWFLVNEYITSLQGYRKKFNEYIILPVFPKYQPEKRFFHFQFLLYFQRKIWSKILGLNTNLEKFVDVGYGTNTVPSIHFWLPFNDIGVYQKLGVCAVYTAIDGSTFKLGVFYNKTVAGDCKYIVEKIKLCLDGQEILKFKEKRIKWSKENRRENSVYAPFSCDLHNMKDSENEINLEEIETKLVQITKLYLEFWLNQDNFN